MTQSNQGFDVDGVDGEAGAAEEVEAHDELAAIGGVAYDFAFETGELAANHAHFVAALQGSRFDAYGTVGVAEHEAQQLELPLGHDSGAACGSGGSAVGHKAVDERQLHNAPALGLGAFHEHGAGYDHALHALTPAVGPHTQFFLHGQIALHIDCCEALCNGFFGVVPHQSHKPVASGHTYGAASDICRCRIRTF